MTDRELLERAAKAAGLIGKWCDAGLNLRTDAWPKIWNPLADDGDALRLAVKLGLGVQYERNAPPELKLPRECAVAIAPSGQWFTEAGTDPMAATRRAIVRAAAELGRAAQTTGGTP